MNTCVRTIAKTFGVALVALGFALTSSMSAQAATTQWKQTGGNYVLLTTDDDSTCSPSGRWHSTEQGKRIQLYVWETGDNCLLGDPQRSCTTSVPAGPSKGYLRLDAITCRWITMTSDRV